jgi:hypothetical protein
MHFCDHDTLLPATALPAKKGCEPTPSAPNFLHNC